MQLTEDISCVVCRQQRGTHRCTGAECRTFSSPPLLFSLECQPFLGPVPIPDRETAGSLKGLVLGITDPGPLSSLRNSFQSEADWYLCARERLGESGNPATLNAKNSVAEWSCESHFPGASQRQEEVGVGFWKVVKSVEDPGLSGLGAGTISWFYQCECEPITKPAAVYPAAIQDCLCDSHWTQDIQM